ncbi:MAG: hypothetical protein ACREQN_08505, partial [Candidatus Binataceae bacterium]
MKLRTYSSLAAFVAHYRALVSASADQGPALADEERATLAAMARLVSAALGESERAALGLTQRIDATACGGDTA